MADSFIYWFLCHFFCRKIVPDYSASREKKDLGFVTFDLKADFTSLFNWNVKELFLYLTAEYKTTDNELNQVVLWDKILLRGENAALDLKNMNTKYYFWDDGTGLKWVWRYSHFFSTDFFFFFDRFDYNRWPFLPRFTFAGDTKMWRWRYHGISYQMPAFCQVSCPTIAIRLRSPRTINRHHFRHIQKKNCIQIK